MASILYNSSLLYSASEIEALVQELADDLNSSLPANYKYGAPIFLVLLNGGAFLGVDLVRKIEVPHEVHFANVQRFTNPDLPSMKLTFSSKPKMEGRHVIIVDEFIDSGETLEKVIQILQTNKVGIISIASLLVRNEEVLTKFDGIDGVYYGEVLTTDAWLLGYGLNYLDSTGSDHRSLKEIYAINKENE